MAGRRKVRRSTHAPTSARLPVPPHASRCLLGAPPEIDGLLADSRSYAPESAFCSQSPVAHEALLRNEGAVGSDPITFTTQTPRSPGCEASLLSAFAAGC